MTKLANGHVIDQKLMTRIEAIDLSNTRNRLLKKGLEAEKVDQAIADYRLFLYVCITHEGEHEPTQAIDEVWHDHILHTKQYAEDCQAIAGRFIHHEPYQVKWDEELGCYQCSTDDKAKSTCNNVGSCKCLSREEKECNAACGQVYCGTCTSGEAKRPFVGDFQTLVPMGAVAKATCDGTLCAMR